MKRAFDIVFSLLGLVALAPALAAVALASLLTSGRPVIFAQERVGLNGRPFSLKKFRTMTRRPGAEAGVFEPGSRLRVTPFGRPLRASKVDELPQLWNVLKGEMSLVGPRPEIGTWVAVYPERWRRVLSVKPGLTDPASVVYRDEEEILARSPDPDRTYREVILPHKLDLYEGYVEGRTFWGDLGLILETLGRVAAGAAPGDDGR